MELFVVSRSFAPFRTGILFLRRRSSMTMSQAGGYFRRVTSDRTRRSIPRRGNKILSFPGSIVVPRIPRELRDTRFDSPCSVASSLFRGKLPRSVSRGCSMACLPIMWAWPLPGNFGMDCARFATHHHRITLLRCFRSSSGVRRLLKQIGAFPFWNSG